MRGRLKPTAKTRLVMSAFLIFCALAACAPPAQRAAEATPEPEPAPTAPPVSAPEPDPVQARLDEIMASMTTEEKLWQLMMVRPGTARALDAPVGGVIFFAEDILSREQLATDIEGFCVGMDIAPFIGVDEEGGDVARVQSRLGTTRFRPMYHYRDDGAETAYLNALTIASDIAELGFNLDFAPVADVWTNSCNTVIGTRAYSDDPGQAAILVAAAVRGFSDGGVIAAVKHFPGHGGTPGDSHDGPAVLDRSLEELAACEFLPFVSGIEAGAGMVMVGHITLTRLDAESPAILSEAVVTDLLRGLLGWDGVVVTDSLEMGAVSGFGSGDLAVRAVLAGVDLLLQPEDALGAVAALQAALESGGLDIERVDESVRRILLLKLENEIIS